MTNEKQAVDHTREELKQEIHAYKDEPSVLSPAAPWRHCPMTDFRALCAELVNDLEEWVDGYLISDPADEHTAASFGRINRARAALAEQPVTPTDEELWAIGNDDFRANYYPTDAIRYARAVLARWGQPATPIPVAERLPVELNDKELWAIWNQDELDTIPAVLRAAIAADRAAIADELEGQ